MRIFSLFLLMFVLATSMQAQKKSKPKADIVKIGAIGFYNLENLFDTLDAENVIDEEFLPNGSKRYGTKLYKDKLHNLSHVISMIGTEKTPDGLAIMGVAEIENRSVLEDLVAQPEIYDRNYQIVHYDSPDDRGIDVGLLYQPKYYKVLSSRSIRVPLYDATTGEERRTRDILFVSGLFDGEPLHVMVNHWPSRRGGEEASQPSRNQAASHCKFIADSLMQEDPMAKVIIMGDLNDDPTSPSVKDVLKAQNELKTTTKGKLYNPMYELHQQGVGSLAYNDSWNLFDQIIISYGLVKGKKSETYQFYKAGVFNRPFMVQKTGRFAGYPLRTFVGDNYMGGYSDHFPTYIYLVKEVK